ncbi:MAG: hypothetical protein ACXVI3_06745 [Halobacteriota archaeon]
MIPVLILLFNGLTPLGGGFTLAALLASFWEAFLGIGICARMLILAKDYWNTTGRIKAVFAKKCVYSVSYSDSGDIVSSIEVHPGGVFIPAGLPPLLQFLLVGALTAALCFLISNYIVRRIPYAKRILF